MKVYIFKVRMDSCVKFIPIKSTSMFNAIKVMRSKGWRNFDIL